MNTYEELVTYFCGIGDQTGSLICQVISLPVSYAPRHEPREEGFTTSIKTVLLAGNAESVGPLSWGWVWWGFRWRLVPWHSRDHQATRLLHSAFQEQRCHSLPLKKKPCLLSVNCALYTHWSLFPVLYKLCGHMWRSEEGWLESVPSICQAILEFIMPGFGGIEAPSARTDTSCGCGKTNFA